jgi:hypothetical protein
MKQLVGGFREGSGGAAAVVGSDIYFMGGFNGEACSAANQIFNIETGKWRPGPPLLAPRSGAVAATIKDTIYLIGAHPHSNQSFNLACKICQAYHSETLLSKGRNQKFNVGLHVWTQIDYTLRMCFWPAYDAPL